jgi:HAD superfamily hydrolase (TIGR01509 family)
MSLTLSSFKAVIFDMDGVLIDSEPVWKIAMQAVFDEVGCGLTKTDFQKTVGLRLDEVILFWYNHTGWKGLTPQEVEGKIVQRMVELISKDGQPLVGVIETLQFLKAKGLKIGLATSSYSVLIETVLNKLNIKNYFDFTHSAELESHGKPHPAVYLTVAEKLGVFPTECLVIEDSLNGIISGKAARMRVVCIPEKTHSPEPRLILADYQFETMLDFLNEIN